MKNLGYSQNFLVNKKLVERLISKSNIDVTDYVIEIGPGKGIITDVLSQHAGEVVAVEYDQELYNNLVRYHSHDNVTYIFGDFLKYKLPLNRRYKIFSNIPFQITADIIRKLTDDVNPPSDINIIIQREAAKKNCGIPLQKYEGFRAAKANGYIPVCAEPYGRCAMTSIRRERETPDRKASVAACGR